MNFFAAVGTQNPNMKDSMVTTYILPTEPRRPVGTGIVTCIALRAITGVKMGSV